MLSHFPAILFDTQSYPNNLPWPRHYSRYVKLYVPIDHLPDSRFVVLVVIHPSEKTLPARVNMQLIDRLQTVAEPQVFTPRAVYDGRKNLFSIREYDFPNGSKEVH